MFKRSLAAGILAAFAVPALADGTLVSAGSVKWEPAPPVLPKGAQLAVIAGDLGANGPYVLRLKLPAGYRVPAHNHPTAENVTVLSGNFHMGMGDKLDMAAGHELTAGGFAEAPPKMNHFAWATTETVVQVHGQGPFAITYVDPADDPSKSQ